VCLVLLAGCDGCGKKKKDEEAAAVEVAPAGPGVTYELTTELGQAHALEESLASTGARWPRVLVLDDKRALLGGDLATESIALLTDDAGKTWRAIRTEPQAWSTWSVAADGTTVLAGGSRDGASSATGATVEATRMLFATFDAAVLSDPSPLFLPPKKRVNQLQAASALAAILAPDLAALIVEEPPHKGLVLYGGRPGMDAVAPVKLPPAERVIPVPYGRPPMLLSTHGHDVLLRPVPAPGKTPDEPKTIPGLTPTPAVTASLAAPPACESREWSFQRVKLSPGHSYLLGISPDRTVGFPLPDGTLDTARVGCGGGKIVVEGAALDGKASEVREYVKGNKSVVAGAPPDGKITRLTLATCDFDGKCALPQNFPFRPWPAPEEHDLAIAPTSQGVVAALSERGGQRWGLYVGQSSDGGMYEQQRVVGEGAGDRGRMDLGALVSFGKRVVLLFAADVAGTSHRRWYVIASDDGGLNWGPP
jgi:hypothetical protein